MGIITNGFILLNYGDEVMTLNEKNAASSLDDLIEKTGHALGANMLAARNVAATGKDEVVTPMSEMALHKKSKISRDVLSRYADNKTPNPDLKTICKLAHALNVPPAFLLMTSDDWRRLIGAINDMQKNVQNTGGAQFVKASIKSQKLKAGLAIAKKLNMYPDKCDDSGDVDWQTWETREQDINRRNDIKRQSILAMTAIAQNFDVALAGSDSATKSKEEYLAILTTLAAIFGARVQTH